MFALSKCEETRCGPNKMVCVDQGSLSSELELMGYNCTVICTKVALCVADLVKYMALHSTVGHCFLGS